MGRPSKLTEETKKRLFQAIQLGCTYEHACDFAGISYQTMRNWIKKGEKATKGKFFDFVADLKKAEGKAVVGWLAHIEKAAKEGTWQAAAWKLERRYPKLWGKAERSEEPDDLPTPDDEPELIEQIPANQTNGHLHQ